MNKAVIQANCCNQRVQWWSRILWKSSLETSSAEISESVPRLQVFRALNRWCLSFGLEILHRELIVACRFSTTPFGELCEVVYRMKGNVILNQQTKNGALLHARCAKHKIAHLKHFVLLLTA